MRGSSPRMTKSGSGPRMTDSASSPRMTGSPAALTRPSFAKSLREEGAGNAGRVVRTRSLACE
jgi:hypothetical protein